MRALLLALTTAGLFSCGSPECGTLVGTYALTPTPPTDCEAGTQPRGTPQHFVFESIAQGTSVTVERRVCTQRWEQCKVIVACQSSSFELAYDAAKDTLSGPSKGVCACETNPGSSTSSDCAVAGTKG